VSRVRLGLGLLLVTWTLLAAAPAVADVAPGANAPTQKEIESALTCQCGCGLTVHSCNHIQCGSGEPMKKDIAERLARGEGREAILAAFASKYGEKVLAAPTFQGFNWLAWVTPFAAVLLAASLLAFAIRRRTHEAAPPTPQPAGPAGGDPALRARLADELDRLERE
jgi:cytochrome c-type biogenesis protein CcmH/NrfF